MKLSQIKDLEAVPEVSFIQGATLERVLNALVQDYTEKYSELTGETQTLSPADPMRLTMQATALILYQCLQAIERAGRQNLLKYAEGEALDNLAALKNCVRLPARAAATVMRFTIHAQVMSVGIPGGTRVATEDGVYFATSEYAELAAGAQVVDVPAEAVTQGKDANGYAAGAVSVIVDPLPYLISAQNITETAGGADIESDSELTARVYAAPGAYSVAGSVAAYAYHARQFRADVDDVKVYSPEPDCVTVLFLLEGGALPQDSDLRAMEAYLSGETIRPVCDHVTAAAPQEKMYTISLTYYINRSERARADQIQTAVSAAVEGYAVWQRKLGRDINASELIRRVMAAGAKRVEITAPTYAVVGENEIAKLSATTVAYGGLEDD